MDTPDRPSGEVVDITDVTRRTAGEATMPLAPAAAGIAIVPRVETVVRVGTLADVPFLDRLQKAHSRELGFLPTMAIEGKIKLGQVLVAEAGGRAVGYLIAADRYFKRDEIGYVTQINVLPEVRRSLVAATLLQAQFDRSAYGCRLYCCWCAQDLKANEFWEAMGFTAIAFRTGSRTKGRTAGGKATPRIHLFWQKRVRAGDTGVGSGDGSGGGSGGGSGDGSGGGRRPGTPWWYPAATNGGEMREDRLVFPIPPGVHWRDVLPVVLPDVLPETANAAIDGNAVPGLEDTEARPDRPERKIARQPKPATASTGELRGGLRGGMGNGLGGGLWFGGQSGGGRAGGGRAGGAARTDPATAADHAATAEANAATRATAKADAKAAAKMAWKAARAKVDPRLVAMARELRDRWAEQVDLILPVPAKHDVRRVGGTTAPSPSNALAGRTMTIASSPMPALPAAA